MSLWGHYVLAEDVPAEDVLGKDMKSTQGHKVLARMSLCGHHVPNKDVPVEDVLDGDVPVKDMSIDDTMSLDGCPCVDIMSSTGTSSAKDIMSTQGLYVLDEEVLV